MYKTISLYNRNHSHKYPVTVVSLTKTRKLLLISEEQYDFDLITESLYEYIQEHKQYNYILCYLSKISGNYDEALIFIYFVKTKFSESHVLLKPIRENLVKYSSVRIINTSIINKIKNKDASVKKDLNDSINYLLLKGIKLIIEPF